MSELLSPDEKQRLADVRRDRDFPAVLSILAIYFCVMSVMAVLEAVTTPFFMDEYAFGPQKVTFA